MRFQLLIARGMARPSSILLFAERPSHPSVPLGDASAVARRCGQGWPSAGACALPLTAASTMARWRRSGSRACARTALLIIAGVILVIAPVTPADAQMAATRVRAASDPFSSFVTEAAQRFGIPAAWIRAVMRVESRSDRHAISPKGAMGVMQLMPDTWAALRVRYGLGRDPTIHATTSWRAPRTYARCMTATDRRASSRPTMRDLAATRITAIGAAPYRRRPSPMSPNCSPLIDGGDVEPAVSPLPSLGSLGPRRRSS